MNGYSQGETWGFLGLGCVGTLLIIVANLAILAGGIWVVVKVLQSMGVL